MTMLDTVTWALCPHIRKAECKKCPATVATEYGAGKQVCRGLAEDAARAAIDALRLECDPFDPVVEAVQTAVDIWPEDKPRPASNWGWVQFVSREEAVTIWNAGVDAILAEPTDIP